MILQSKVRGPIALLAVLALATVPVWSQEEAGEDEGRKTHLMTFDYEGWIMQPAGLNYIPATIADPTVSVDNEAVQTTFNTERMDRAGLGFRIPNHGGTVGVFYQAVIFDNDQSQYIPGNFVFGETLAYRVPQGQIGGPGVNDDGFADGYLYSTSTTLREYALTYGRNAFRTQRVEGRWSIGWRNTRLRRNQEATYYAVLSPLPPLLPPNADCFGSPDEVPDGVLRNCSLSPNPDTASVGSTYDGRGPMAALDVDVNLWRDKLVFESSLGYTVQRGKMNADYIGTNSYYFCTGDAVDPETGEGCRTGEIITAPWSQINQLIEEAGGDVTRVSEFVDQGSLSAGIKTTSESWSSDILDLYLGLRYRVFDWFEVSGGFRSSRYSDVGLDVIPQDVTTSVSGAVGVPTTEVKKTSVTFEGFTIGLRFSFF